MLRLNESNEIAGNDLSIGADILIDAALGDRFASASGKYFDNDSGSFADPHSAALNPAHAEAVMTAVKALAV